MSGKKFGVAPRSERRVDPTTEALFRQSIAAPATPEPKPEPKAERAPKPERAKKPKVAKPPAPPPQAGPRVEALEDSRHWSQLSPEERAQRSAARRADRLARTFTAQLPTVRDMAARVADAARYFGVTTGEIVETALLRYLGELEEQSGESFSQQRAKSLPK